MPPAAEAKHTPAEKVARKVVIVLCNIESPITVQLPGSTKHGSHNAGPTFRLIPGLSFIDPSRWATAKENETIRHYLSAPVEQTRAMKVAPERVGHPHLVEVKTVSADNPWAELDDKEAIQLLPEIKDRRLLVQLSHMEMRPAVQTAFREAIYRFDNPQIRKEPPALGPLRIG